MLQSNDVLIIRKGSKISVLHRCIVIVFLYSIFKDNTINKRMTITQQCVKLQIITKYENVKSVINKKLTVYMETSRPIKRLIYNHIISAKKSQP